MATVSSHGLELYYEVRGSGEGPTLVLLHGNTASSAVFSAMVGELEKRRQVILVDLLGHGRSDRFPREPRHLYERNALALLELFRALELYRADLLGTGGGALVACNLALIAPERVRRVVGDSFYGQRLSPEEALELAAGREQAVEDPELQEFWHSLHGEDWREVVNLDTLALTEMTRRRLPLFVADPSKLTEPVLLTCSREDDLVPKVVERMEELSRTLPAARLMVFDTGGHPAMFSNASPFLAALEGFLGAP